MDVSKNARFVIIVLVRKDIGHKLGICYRLYFTLLYINIHTYFHYPRQYRDSLLCSQVRIELTLITTGSNTRLVCFEC